MLNFGSGNFYGTSSNANSTPTKLGVLQDVSFDFSFTTKEARGSGQFAIDIRRGAGKISGKAKFMTLKGKLFNDLFFGQTASTGLLLCAVGEAAAVPATPYQITAVNGATFDTDLCAVY